MNKQLRIALLINILYTLIYVFVFMRRSLEGYALETQGSIIPTLNALTFIIPFFAFLPLFCLEARPNFVSYLWNKFASISSYVLYTGIAISLLLTIFNVTGVGWTWMSLGIHQCLLLTAFTSLRRKLPPGEALVLAIGMTAFVIGSWEIPFRFLAYHFYGSQFWEAGPFLSYAVLQEVPNILGSLFILHFYNRKYHLLSFDSGAKIFLSLFVVSWLVWIALGFWLDPIFNGKEIVYNPETSTSYIQYVLFRGTKAWLNWFMLFWVGGLGSVLKSRKCVN